MPDSKLPGLPGLPGVTGLTKRGAPIHRGGFFYGPIQRGIRLQTGWEELGIREDSAERMLEGFEIKTDTDFEKDGGFFGWIWDRNLDPRSPKMAHFRNQPTGAVGQQRQEMENVYYR